MRFIYFFLTIFPYLIYSQDITDAINWSIENESGNARYSAMGGAFGALGGNLSAISSNPASGAVFELSRFGGSLVSNINQTKSNFKSNINNVNSQNANYQIGLVYVFKNYGSGDLNKFSIGLNYQSQNNYNEDIKIKKQCFPKRGFKNYNSKRYLETQAPKNYIFVYQCFIIWKQKCNSK